MGKATSEDVSVLLSKVFGAKMNQASDLRKRRLISKFVISALIFMAVGVNAGKASAATYAVTPNQNFYFSLVSSTTVVFYTSDNGSVDPDLYLYNSQGSLLTYDYDSAGSLNSRISITLPAGDYRLYATYYQTWGFYTLNSTFTLSPVATTTTTTTTTVAPTTTTTVPIAVPTVSWASVPSGSVSSSFTVKASAASSATITKWCLTLDGNVLASNLSVYDSSYFGVYYYGSFSSSTGCWSSSYTSLTSGAFTINPMAMTNGSHTLALVVYDSRSVASVAASTTFTVGITAPSVSWASVPSGSVSSSFTVKASAASSATITKWCLTLDGNVLASNLSVYDSSYFGVYYYGSFSSSTGCWSSSYTSLTSGAFTINPMAMTNGSHTLALVVYDSRSVASVAASTTFTVGITAPSVSWASVPSGSVSSSFTVKASAVSGVSSATISKWCLTLDGSIPASNLSVYDSTYSRVNTNGVYSFSTGCWLSSYTSLTSGAFTINPSALSNGPHMLTLIAYDSRSVASATTSTTFTVAIPVPTIKPTAVTSPKKKVVVTLPPKKKVVITLPPKKKAAAVIPKVVGMTKSNAVKTLQAKKMKAQVKIDSNCKAKLGANLDKWRVVRQLNLVLFICQ